MPCLELGLDNWLCMPSPGHNASDKNKGASAESAVSHCMHAQGDRGRERFRTEQEVVPTSKLWCRFFFSTKIVTGGAETEETDGEASGKTKSRAQAVARATAKNNIHEEQHDGQQQVDPGAVGAATRDEWIMVLEREASRADPNTNWGFDVCAGTLRTASRHALTS